MIIMAILRLLVITSLTIIHLGVVQVNDVAAGRPVHEREAKHLSNVRAAKDKGFQIGSILMAPQTIRISEAVFPKNIRDKKGSLSPVATIPSKPQPLKDPKPSHTHQMPSIRSPRSLSCQHDQFACADGLQCISEDFRCDGDGDCE